MMDETHAGEVAEMIAQTARDNGFEHTAPAGDAISCFGRVTVKMPNGQVFRIEIEEVEG